MSKDLLVQGKAANALQVGMLAVEQFLSDRYLLRRNVLNGKVEFAAKPSEGEQGMRMRSGDIVKLIQREYPSIKSSHSTMVHLGLALKELGFESTEHGHQRYYRVIPLKAA